MGIKYFFSWLRSNFGQHILSQKVGASQSNMPDIDVLMFDMNGIFHNVCAHVYEYGPFKRENLLQRRVNHKDLQLKAFKEVCDIIDFMVNFVKPKEKILLCIDGIAPQSKQNQQRSRRFRSANDKSDEEFNKFDSNCISPGTQFMDYLGKYIDFYIQSKVGKEWNFEVIFSNDKVPGEAEHKLIDYARKLNEEERKKSFMVYGMDADLIMLTLGTMLENMHIIRENTFAIEKTFYILNIGEIRKDLYNKMNWNEDEEGIPRHFYDYKNAVYDFIAMCFTVGNDFLPQIPTIEIYEGGIEIMFDNYKSVCREYGHLTEITKSGVIFNKNTLKKFFECMMKLEKNILEQKLSKKEVYFPDEYLESCAKITDGVYNLDFEKYRNVYNEKKLGGKVRQSCLKYLEGMQWVLTYYIEGCKEWNWTYPFHYTPFMTDLYDYIDSFNLHISKQVSQPCYPYFQLVRILPPRSRRLLPLPLQKIFDGKLKEYFPEKFEVDLKGKKNEWEGIVILPFLDDKELLKEYNVYIRELTDSDRKRNTFGKTFIYKPSAFVSRYSSYYGEMIINCVREMFF